MPNISKKGLVSALSVTLGLVMIFYFGWRADQNQIREARTQTVESTASLLSELIQETVNENLLLLANHKSRVEFTKGQYFENFEFETNLLLNVKPAFTFFEWIDQDGVIQLIEPYEGNREAIGLDILELDYRREDWMEMKRDSSINMTPWTDLVQSGSAFLIDAPLYYNNEFHGSLTVGMDFTDDFDDIMAGREMFSVEIRDENDRIFYEYLNSDIPEDEKYTSTQKLNFISGSSNEWTLTLSLDEDYFSSGILNSGQISLFFRMLIALLFGSAIYFMISAYRANKRNVEALKEKEVLISEIHHRVKNNLAVISSLIDLQRLETDDEYVIDILQKTQNRIHSIAGVHELLYNSDDLSSIPFRQYLSNLINRHLDVYVEDKKSIDVKIDSSVETLSINQALPLGVLISELVTNSFKHAFTDKTEGEIHLNVTSDRDYVHVQYFDNGPGFQKEQFEDGKGLGITIIKALIGQLQAKYKLESEDGFKLKFSFKKDFPK
ncbi:histidine kinase dimerization/phosphoacceptor domain -containing protein [Rhodohalobacter sp.]|uniref:histidine kinase dimerization/phosphoacceptor domain -containing protein n=1 Tax=Rhodohalobacter sp. TaxID=1974210 RepID=UPI002ACD5163|nr:histidine kinase dimerization/phosphoacceptor domain -containing protein [Rhodohalobacter sp.]MDZ7757887.1 histidine kinase dimerization/phosphoacceptor domain -containing protein [Rhodohalobacter sp.]